MKRFSRIIVALSLGLSLNTSAQAADFTINVPVELLSMPSTVTEVVVKCAVRCGTLGTGTATSGPLFVYPPDAWNLDPEQPDVVGVGYTVRPINTGTGHLNETISVAVHVNPAHERYPHNARSYVCTFRLRTNEGQEGFPGQGNISEFSLYFGPGKPKTYPLVSSGNFNNIAQVGSRCDDPDVNR